MLTNGLKKHNIDMEIFRSDSDDDEVVKKKLTLLQKKIFRVGDQKWSRSETKKKSEKFSYKS